VVFLITSAICTYGNHWSSKG